MRSFSNISKILSQSKKKINDKTRDVRRVLVHSAQESEQKCKDNYFYEVDKFLSCSSNDFLDAFPILVVIEKNKDTFLGAFLIKNVAFPILRMSYPDPEHRFPRYNQPTPLKAILGYSTAEEKHRQEYIININASLSTAMTCVQDNIRHYGAN